MEYKKNRISLYDFIAFWRISVLKFTAGGESTGLGREKMINFELHEVSKDASFPKKNIGRMTFEKNGSPPNKNAVQRGFGGKASLGADFTRTVIVQLPQCIHLRDGHVWVAPPPPPLRRSDRAAR